MSDLFDDANIPSESKQDTIIDPGTFISVPTWVYEYFKTTLGPLGLAVYVGLKSYANRKQDYSTFVAVKRIADDLEMGISTVRREIAKLEEIGLLSRSFSKGRPTKYFISQTPPGYGPRHHIEDTPPLYRATPPQNENITRCINQMNLTISEKLTSLPSSKEGLADTSEVDSALVDVWNYYIKTFNRNPKLYTLTDKRKKMGMGRLKEALAKCSGKIRNAVELMCAAIDAMTESDFHNGKNDQKKKYLEWEHLFSSTERFERWIS